ncbi:endonuclease toxin domain-containing protein [Martelella alba]|uniref:CdiA toxin EC869-like domain-containing protein n=1 Tax=Martelella alba TaxID=2590451 RepID=A0ABY2SDD9_9HYPH|nr:hypothetical protein [Martelella alba]TKI02391.1 hypothetical protein FCN80_25185 [Martelella alba]
MPGVRVEITCGVKTIKHPDGRKTYVSGCVKEQKSVPIGPKVSAASNVLAQQRLNRNIAASNQSTIKALQQQNQKVRDDIAKMQSRQADNIANRQKQIHKNIASRSGRQAEFNAAMERHHNFTKSTLQPHPTVHNTDEHQCQSKDQETQRRHEEESGKPFYQKHGHEKRFSTNFPRNFRLDNPYQEKLIHHEHEIKQTLELDWNDIENLTSLLDSTKKALSYAQNEKKLAEKNVHDKYKIELAQCDISSSGYFAWSESHGINNFEERIAFRDSIGRNQSWEDLRPKLIDNEMARRRLTAANDEIKLLETKIRDIDDRLKNLKIEQSKPISKKLVSASNINELDLEKLFAQLRFLNTSQQAAKAQQIGACEALACDIGVQAKWTSIEAGQFIAFGSGVVTGAPAELYDVVKGIVDAAMSPNETILALKALINNGNILSTVADAVKEKWIAHIDNMVAAQERGGLKNYFEAGVEGGKLVTDVVSLASAGIGMVKLGATAVEVGTERIGQYAAKLTGQASKYQSVKLADTKITWGGGIEGQGIPWENFLEPRFKKGTRLPEKFKTFDFYDPQTRTAISAKTLDTQAAGYLKNPKDVYSTLKQYIDKENAFRGYEKDGIQLKAAMIDKKEMQLAIPAKTTDTQWVEIERAIAYANDSGIELIITKVE